MRHTAFVNIAFTSLILLGRFLVLKPFLLAILWAAVNGLVIVGLGEAIIISVMYQVFDVPSAALLGLLTALIAFIPMAADYVVRPMPIQGSAEIPFLAVLFGILGGVAAMGILGLIIGPVILVLLMVLFREASINESADMGL